MQASLLQRQLHYRGRPYPLQLLQQLLYRQATPWGRLH